MFQNTTAYTFHGWRRTITEWSFSDATSGLTSGSVEIHKSALESGPFEKVDTVPALDKSYTHHHKQNLGARSTFFYRLHLIRDGHPVLLSRIFSDLEFGTAKNQFMFSRIVDKQIYSLRYHGGVRALLYRYPYVGAQCPVCVDSRSGQSVGRSQCEHCHGTGVEGGYAAPVLFYYKELNTPQSGIVHQDSLPAKKVSSVTVASPGLPRIYPRDVIYVPQQDRRFRVGDNIATPKMVGNIPVEYQYEIERVASDDIIYKLPVPEGFLTSS